MSQDYNKHSTLLLWFIPLLTALIAVLIQFKTMIFSDFRFTHGGMGDGRLVNYTLEHGYRWLLQIPPHENFWNPPIFYPYTNVSAFTDLMLSFGPFFWIWRALGALPDTALQLWLLTIYMLNFSAAYILLRYGVRVSILAASAGALLVSSIMVNWTPHIQLFPIFYILIALLSLIWIFGIQSSSTEMKERRCWIVLFFCTSVLQAWGAVYPFFFFGFLLGLAVLTALIQSEPRKALVAGIRRDLWWWFFCAAIAILAIYPVVHHYGITALDLGYRKYNPDTVPQPLEWILMGRGNLLFVWLRKKYAFFASFNNRFGIGVLTFLAGIAGIYIGRSKLSVRVLALATLTFLLLATMYGTFSPWKFLHEVVPGAGAIRAFHRVPMILTPLAAIGFAIACEQAFKKRRWIIFILLIVACVGEHLHMILYIDKIFVREHIASISEQIDPQYDAFFLVGTRSNGMHIPEDAAWVSLHTGIPTINGRYGNFPPKYKVRLRKSFFSKKQNKQTRQSLELALKEWLDRNNINRKRIQWVEYKPLTKREIIDNRPKRRTKKNKRI